MENPCFEKMADFPVSCEYVMVLPHVTEVHFWRPKIKASFGIKTCHLVMPLIMGPKKCGLLKSIDFLFFTFYGSKSGILGQKTAVLSVLNQV